MRAERRSPASRGASPRRSARRRGREGSGERRGGEGGGRRRGGRAAHRLAGLRSLALPGLLGLVLSGAIALLFASRGGIFAPPPARRGEEIVVGGERVPIGTPVVLWSDPGGYDAYLTTCFFDRTRVLPTHPAPGADTPERIGKRRGRGPLAEVVTQLVLHYDMAWTSRNCFKVLHDQRGLSVHFLCDMDGTIYQTCDVAERCRHAREANDRSVGVEIAHPGALEEVKGLAARYKADEAGVRLELPAAFGAEPFRKRGFIPRPARAAPVAGRIHGKPRTMWDYTDAQYRALARLAAGLSRALPRIRLEAPRDAGGRVLDGASVISPSSVAFEGIVGHHHLQTDKFDPGPAFDWERFLEEARRIRAGGEP